MFLSIEIIPFSIWHLLAQSINRLTIQNAIADFIKFIAFAFFSFLFLVSQQENVTGHGTYVEYVDSGLYATTAQGQAQM